MTLFVGCSKGNFDEAKEKQVINIKEKFDKALEKKLLEKAERAGIKNEILEALEKKKKEEAGRMERLEKDAEKILGVTGRPVEDKYIEELFTPEFPIEGVKIVEEHGIRYLIIKAKKRISQEQKNKYIFETLLNRGVSVHRKMSAHSGVVYDFMITVIRKTGTPGVVEYSENLIPQPPQEPNKLVEVREALRFKGGYILIELTPEFGHEFKRKVIYPEKEIDGPEPRDIPGVPEIITRYPNSKRIEVYYRKENGKKVLDTIIYVSDDPIEKIMDFFIQKKKDYYDQNLHMRTSSLYRKGEEQYYLRMHLQTNYMTFGMKDIGGGVSHFPISDFKKNTHVVIDLYQSANTNLKDYVEIHISH
jgi:hypothetical protein